MLSERDLSALIEESRHLRSANLILFDSFSKEILDRTGRASDCDFNVRSVLYALAGHERHHIGILKERYGLKT